MRATREQPLVHSFYRRKSSLFFQRPHQSGQLSSQGQKEKVKMYQERKTKNVPLVVRFVCSSAAWRVNSFRCLRVIFHHRRNFPNFDSMVWSQKGGKLCDTKTIQKKLHYQKSNLILVVQTGLLYGVSISCKQSHLFMRRLPAKMSVFIFSLSPHERLSCAANQTQHTYIRKTYTITPVIQIAFLLQHHV